LTRAFVLGLVLGLFSGVRSTVERIGPERPPRERDCAVQFLQTAPEAAYEPVAVINVWVRRNKLTTGKKAVSEEAEP